MTSLIYTCAIFLTLYCFPLRERESYERKSKKLKIERILEQEKKRREGEEKHRLIEQKRERAKF
jgi:hypothetical protein